MSCVHHRACRWEGSLGAVDGPLVGVIMGSDSDLPVMQGAVDVLAEFESPARPGWPPRTAPDMMMDAATAVARACGSSSPAPAGPRTCRA